VPYGFICGFPVKSVSSEHWGYVAGGEVAHAQASAVAAALAIWAAPGLTELPFPVCKTGYRPFDPVTGRQLFGCGRHSSIREERMAASNGYTRPGWESFCQWQRPDDALTITAAPASATDDDDSGSA
jgi:hypothetical protein